ncbi:MAG: helix-hairpin-helix domain-containing protein [Planctomycetes bacterium]|nr:helix-hairpin-helix domain-containing protein [Planctomycetota bacterium]
MKRAPRAIGYLILWGVLALVVVLRKVEEHSLRVRSQGTATPAFAIDLNRDPWERLALIDGVGEKLARRIAGVRAERGGFRSFAEVLEIPGVPDRKLEEARPWLTLDGRAVPAEDDAHGG